MSDRLLKAIGSESEQITNLSKEPVSCSTQILKPELSWFLERRAISQIDQRARHRTIAEQPVCRELVRGISRIEYAIYEHRITVSILEWRPRPRCVLTDQPQEDWRADLILHFDAWNRLRRES